MFRPTEDDLVLPVEHSFWPFFFASTLSVKLLHSVIAFSLESLADKSQLIFVYPEEGCSCQPTIDELALVFPINGRGQRKIYDNPHAIPIPHDIWRSVVGFHLRKKQYPNRLVTVLYPIWGRSRQLRISIANLHAMDFNLPESEMAQLVRKSAHHEILCAQFWNIKHFGFIRVFLMIEQGTTVQLSKNIIISCSKDGILEASVQQLN